MSGFVPVPHDALNAVEPREWGAVVDLYKRAHALRWQSFSVTERSMSTRWDIGNRRCWSLLEVLRDLGLLEFTRGGRRRATTIRVFCPTSEPSECGTRGQHSGRHKGQQNDTDTTKGTEKRAAQVAAQGAAHVDSDSNETKTRHETEHDAGTRGETPWATFKRLLLLYPLDWSAGLPPPSREHPLRRAVGRLGGHTALVERYSAIRWGPDHDHERKALEKELARLVTYYEAHPLPEWRKRGQNLATMEHGE